MGNKDNNPHGEIVIYQSESGNTKIDVRMEDKSVWLTQAQLVELYQTTKSNVSEHIKYIFEDGELDKVSVVRNFRTTASDGKTYNVKYYNTRLCRAKSCAKGRSPGPPLEIFRIPSKSISDCCAEMLFDGIHFPHLLQN